MSKKANNVKGYKVFNPDWTCRGFQYELEQTYEEDVTPIVCFRGFHFCKNPVDCFDYYDFNPENKVAEVIALGEIDSDDKKSCTNKIQIVREVPWDEVLRIVNTGKGCTGISNSGNYNSGDYNSGDYNSGDLNSGYRNSGDRNSGDRNSGDLNSGYRNSGDRNSGDRNSGDRNSGYRNSGNYNSGDWNSGNYNSGDYNSGKCNSGDWNSGNYNSGDYNSGKCNSGNYNSGDYNSGKCNSGNYNSGDGNSGDWNKSSFNAGCFNITEQKLIMFDKPSDWTHDIWLRSEARFLLNQIPQGTVTWILSDNMTDEEKEAHPEHVTTGGYLKIFDEVEKRQNWWDNLYEYNKNVIKSLPNFDAYIFEKCTGIKVS